MGKELLSLLETTLIPQVIEQIILKDKINEIKNKYPNVFNKLLEKHNIKRL